MAVPDAVAATPPRTAAPVNEHVATGPGHRMNRPDQLPASIVAATQRRPTTGSAAIAPMDAVAPFLTRPYWDPHSVNSIFDHCNPDYSRDGRICDVDGNVAYSSNGVDPTFTAGYALTPGGTDYLYYDGHNGWDLGLNYENLIAAAPGIVQIAGYDAYNPGFGLTVTIDHGNGFTTRYAHMSYVAVTAGQSVARGQSLGVSGNTGSSTGPHLHFGLYVTNPWTAIDPWGWGGSGADPWPYDAGNKWITGNPQNPIPWAPSNVTASPLSGSAQVSWSAPAFDGGDGVSQYTITASPGGATMTVAGSSTTATFGGLANYTTYTFTVVAANALGSSPASSPSNPVTPNASFPGRVLTLVPARIVDSRSGLGGVTTLQPGGTAAFAVAGQGGVPAGAVAVVANLTAVNGTAPGYLSVYPDGASPPGTSTVNYGPGRQVANLTQVGIGGDGKVAVLNGSSGTVDIVVDVSGWVAGAAATGPDGHYQALNPARILDTRTALNGYRPSPLGPGQTLDVQVTGRGGVPATGVAAAMLDVTVLNPTASSYLSLWPAGAPPASPTSNLNFAPGQVLTNRVLVRVGNSGRVTILNSQGRANVIVDVGGWFTDGSNTTVSNGLFTALTPVRILDTRTGTGGYSTPLGPNSWLSFPVAGQPGLPGTGVRAVALNVTAAEATTTSFLTVAPVQSTAVTSWDVNYAPGDPVPNLVLATVGSDGRVHVYNGQGSTAVIIDLLGWYS